ncbi:hypothetical protein [Peterkaempfera sp. SMS 1(5)a]|uniref:hypothetical protein n=1 Tax=Peterkaempfera podocarpi TaxID=3232308 RepID=UPI0036703286
MGRFGRLRPQCLGLATKAVRQASDLHRVLPEDTDRLRIPGPYGPSERMGCTVM